MENWENIQLPWPDWTITAYLGGGGYGKVYQIERTVSGLQEEAALKSFLRQAPANFLALRPARDGLAARIHRQLRATPPAAWPDFASLARQLHLSPATLRRRLAQEGQSYRRVQEAARQALAMTLLANRALSLAEVASALGFAETSAFCRAFKRWTGQRPGDCRP